MPTGEKDPPPRGYTGWVGRDPSGADVQAWCEGPEGLGNIGLRLPHGVYGLDVDDYEGKTGGVALGALVRQWGPLPPAWIVSSRDDTVSGIRLFRAKLPEGRRWRDEPAGHGRGIEAIHFGHRYAVVWPSVHPDTGHKYVWRRPDGMLSDEGEVPQLGDLTELPAAWISGLSEIGETRTGEAAGHQETVEAVHRWREGEACQRVRAALERGVARLHAAQRGAALHPAARDTTQELVALGHMGHAGARAALTEHYELFMHVRLSRSDARAGAAEAEWWRLVRGAVGKLRPHDARSVCDCALWTGEALLLDWAPAGGAARESASDDDDAEGASAGVLPGASVNPVQAMLAELLTSSQIEARPAPIALVRGLLYYDTLAWLIGKSGTFKSFIALDLAQHVGLGRAWAGRLVRPSAVLYLVAEGAGGMTLRMRAWRKHSGIPPAENVVFLPRPVQAIGAEWGTLVEVARHLAPGLIVIDTQARVTVGIKENDNSEMGQLIAQVDRLRKATGACVLLVHHIGRNGDDARGASAIDGAQDTELKIERTGGPRSLAARLVIDKQKDGADTATVDFEMIPIDLGTDPTTGDPLSSLAVNTAVFVSPASRPWEDDLPAKLGRIMDVLHEQFSESGATAAQVLAVLRERGWSTEYPRTTFYRAWNDLQKQDRIERIRGTQRWLIAES